MQHLDENHLLWRSRVFWPRVERNEGKRVETSNNNKSLSEGDRDGGRTG